MEWHEFMSWAIQCMIAGGISYSAWCIGKLKESVEDLNKQMATILERDVWHTKWLEKHDAEIKDLQYNKLGG